MYDFIEGIERRLVHQFLFGSLKRLRNAETLNQLIVHVWLLVRVCDEQFLRRKQRYDSITVAGHHDFFFNSCSTVAICGRTK